MSNNSTDRRFDVLCQITRAQHFAWREAVAERIPAADVPAVVDRMWEVTGEQTGATYAKRIDLSSPVAPQLAKSIVWSSDCMGEDAVAEPGVDGEAFVRHSDCPWFHWHKRMDLVGDDRPGCDAWIQSTISRVNRDLGCNVKFETLESLPEGGSCCLRRLWEDSE